MKSNRQTRLSTIALVRWFVLAVVAHAASGAPVDAEFPQPFNTEQNVQSQPLAAELAAEQCELPAGFTATVFAAEPDVQNPIALTWDSRGRLWVAENYTYAERPQRFALDLQDRVLVFSDTNGDGRSDNERVFLDSAQCLTSIEVGHGGVWLMCPPQLLFVPDRDRDDQPDGPAEVVLDGFTVALENYHNFANGLRWGPDGWLYGRVGGSCPGKIGRPSAPDEQRHVLAGGLWRYHPQRKVVEVLNAGTTNPWGHDWNAMGEAFFVNTVNGHLWHLIPGSHLDRPFMLDPNPYVYQLLEQHADHWHFDTGQSWQASRDGAANQYGGGHAHSGTAIYLGDNWPDEYRDRLLTLNLHGRRINQELLEREGSGYVGRHGRDFYLSADPWFRGLDLSCGPDGAVYVLDWSDTGECHESTGVHRTSGRVYRIHYGDNPRKRYEDLRSLTDSQLAALHQVRNEWLVRQARLILAERAMAHQDVSSAQRMLRDLLLTSSSDHVVEQVRSLLTLYGIGAVDGTLLRSLMDHPNEHVRAWAIRLLTDGWPLDGVVGPEYRSDEVQAQVEQESREWVDDLIRLGRQDPSGLVRLTLASTLQRLPVARRPALATALVLHEEDSGDHNLPLMVWYGLIPVARSHPQSLVDVAMACRWGVTRQLIARRLAESIEQVPLAINRLLELASDVTDLRLQMDVLAGMQAGLRGWRQAPVPEAWERFRLAVAHAHSSAADELLRELSVVFGDGRALEEIQAIALDPDATTASREVALQTLINNHPDNLRSLCERLLPEAHLNVIAAQGLAGFDDPAVGDLLIKQYSRFRATDRPQLISILVSRRTFAVQLLDAIAAQKIPRTDVSAFQIRQIQSQGNDELSAKIIEVWGAVRESDEAKLGQMAAWKAKLQPVDATREDLARGRQLFVRTCSTCHRLYGQGEMIGPDLTGSGRHDLDYLLQNIIDPSAVVASNYRMQVVMTDDGRVYNGIVAAQTERTITLRTQTESVTLERNAIEEIVQTELSPMPDGLLDNLDPQQVRQLIAYLRYPNQVPLPAE